MLQIHQIPVLSDNYVYLAHDPATGTTAVIDPAVAEPVLAVAAARGWRVTHILNTHHHPDHVGGNEAIQAVTGCAIVGPRADAERIPGLSMAVAEGDRVALGTAEALVFEVHGHTRGHIAYWFAEDRALFCGDTIFALGCGRLFEGTPDQMLASLDKLAKLPPATRIYCAHEYTQSNARFAMTVDPDNRDLRLRKKKIDAARAKGEPTVPSLLSEELATNPFLRVDSEAIRVQLGLVTAERVQVFAEIRGRKDRFR